MLKIKEATHLMCQEKQLGRVDFQVCDKMGTERVGKSHNAVYSTLCLHYDQYLLIIEVVPVQAAAVASGADNSMARHTQGRHQVVSSKRKQFFLALYFAANYGNFIHSKRSLLS